MFGVVQTPLDVLAGGIERVLTAAQEADEVLCEEENMPNAQVTSTEVYALTDLEKGLAGREGYDDQTEEKPQSVDLFRTRIVRELTHALNVDLVAEFLSVETTADHRLDEGDFRLGCSASFAALSSRIPTRETRTT